jgi:hypothetical protein
MKKISVMSWADSNIAGYSWTWFVTLTVRKDKTYSIGAFQTSSEPPTYKLPSIYPLRRGRQVRDAIEEIFSDDSLCDQSIDWDEIISNIALHIPKLAFEIQEAFVADLKTEEAKEIIEKPINELINLSEWPRSQLRGLAGPMENSRRRSKIFAFVLKFFSDNRRFPIGEYKIDETLVVKFPNQ